MFNPAEYDARITIKVSAIDCSILSLSPLAAFAPHRGRNAITAGVFIAAAALFSQSALADEGGVSFWIPGFFGSLAAAPQQPGWSMADIYYHTSVSAGANVALSREFEIGNVPTNLSARLNAAVSININGTGDLGFVIPTYVFATPVLGGQAAFAVAGAYGVSSASLGERYQETSQRRSVASLSCDLTASAIRRGASRTWCRNSPCVGMQASTTT
ncbi:MAG: hypothetical protein ACLQDM_07135 [Bradyrhizobium sp.]